MNSDLELISIKLRKRIIENSSKAKIPHLGSCLSCLDLLVYLYWHELNIDPKEAENNKRDRFILSKGHGAPALFQVLAERGFFSFDEYIDYGQPGSLFHEHPPIPGLIPGIEAATGSLGHGLPMALGMAIAEKIKKLNYRTYAMISDGECNEGSIWESAMMASSLKINKLTVIIDYNKWQATGRSKEILALEPLGEKWKSFGWDTQEIDGHNFEQIKNAFDRTKCMNNPNIIIAHTIKGKGISFMEDDNNWHYRIPNKEELENAINELNR